MTNHKGIWYEIPEAAKFLGCTVSNIRNRIHCGKLRVVKLGSRLVISESDLVEYRDTRKKGAPFGNQNWKGKKVDEQ